MKIIQKLSDRIEDEIRDAKDYVLMALEVKDEYPELGRILYTISMQEMDHMRMLHDGVTGVISAYRSEHGEPPEKMMAVYEYLHQRHIAWANKIRARQDNFLKK